MPETKSSPVPLLSGNERPTVKETKRPPEKVIPDEDRLVSKDFKYGYADIEKEFLHVIDGPRPAGYPEEGLRMTEKEYKEWERGDPENGIPPRDIKKLIGEPGNRPAYFVERHENRYEKGILKPQAEFYDGRQRFPSDIFGDLETASDGSPLMPFFKTLVTKSQKGIITGPGFYYKLGAGGKEKRNQTADSVILREIDGKLQVLLIERTDGGGIALPGGHIDPEDELLSTNPALVAIEAAIRESGEEAGAKGLREAPRVVVRQNLFVADRRATAQSGPVTTVVLFMPDQESAEAMELKAGSDAEKVEWEPVWLDLTEGALFASHSSYLKLGIQKWQEVTGKVVAKDGVIGISEAQDLFLSWTEELKNPPQRKIEIVHKLVSPDSDEKGFDGRIGDFGSMDPEWRADAREATKEFIDILYGEGFFDEHSEEILFDPEVRGREWTPDDAVNEARALLRNVVVRNILMGRRPAVGSAAEAGIIALMGITRKRKTLAIVGNIEDLDNLPQNLRESYQRARELFLADGQYLEASSPFPNLYQIYSETELIELIRNSVDARHDFIEQLKTPRIEAVELPPPQRQQKKQIVLSGSSKDPKDPAYQGIPGAISRSDLLAHWQERGYENGIEYWDTKIDKITQDQKATNPWGATEWSTSFYRDIELPLKDESLINVVLINDATSFGSLKDAGLAIYRAAVNGSYAVISLPESVDQEGKVIKGDYTRARTLVLKQFEKLAEEIPWINHYVRFVNNAQEMNETIDAIMNKE